MHGDVGGGSDEDSDVEGQERKSGKHPIEQARSWRRKNGYKSEFEEAYKKTISEKGAGRKQEKREPRSFHRTRLLQLSWPYRG